MGRKPKIIAKPPERKPCVTEDWKEKEWFYKLCSGGVKTPFSWWCNQAKKGGYQFLEEHASFTAERYRRVPWVPTHADKRDDTWPYNCDPLRCANSKMPSCLEKIIYGDHHYHRKPCKKYRLKAPLFKLPAILGEKPRKQTCFCRRICPIQPKISYECRIHCRKDKETGNTEIINPKQDKDCQCSYLESKLSIQTPKEFKDSFCDPPSSVGSEHCLSSELLRELNMQEGVTENKHLLEASFSCPAKTKAGTYPKCLLKEAFRDYRSCQELMNENRKRRSPEEATNPFLKYLRCFNLEKDTLEYIQKCFCESQKEKKVDSQTKQDPSTKIIFEKIADEKFDKVISILEVSENIEDGMGKDDLFTLLVKHSLPETLDEKVEEQYRKMFYHKLEHLNSVLKLTSQEPETKDSAETKKKLFLEKLQLIHSIIELTEKMKAALEADDFTAIMFDTSDSDEIIKNQREKSAKEKGKEVETILDKRKDMKMFSSEITPTSLTLEVSSSPAERKSGTTSKPNEKVDSGGFKRGKDSESEGQIPVIEVDVEKTTDQVVLMRTPMKNSSSRTPREVNPIPDKAVCFDSQISDQIPCPCCYFEIDAYMKGLSALITTYDPFLSPYSPMRDKILARKLHQPKKMISTKKCFPISTCICSVFSNKAGGSLRDDRPISVLPVGVAETVYEQSCRPRNIEQEMRKWKHNWTGRKKNSCKMSGKKCPYGIH